MNKKQIVDRFFQAFLIAFSNLGLYIILSILLPISEIAIIPFTTFILFIIGIPIREGDI